MIIGACLAFTLSVQAKEKEDYWLIGPLYSFDGINYDFQKNRFSGSPEMYLGMQGFYKHDRWYGTGGHFAFSQTDNTLEMGLNARYFYTLPLVEPYFGGNLNYSTRDKGGFSLALRPGAHIQIFPHTILDVYALGRYDLFDHIFGVSSQEETDKTRFYAGFGLSVMYQY